MMIEKKYAKSIKKKKSKLKFNYFLENQSHIHKETFYLRGSPKKTRDS